MPLNWHRTDMTNSLYVEWSSCLDLSSTEHITIAKRRKAYAVVNASWTGRISVGKINNNEKQQKKPAKFYIINEKRTLKTYTVIPRLTTRLVLIKMKLFLWVKFTFRNIIIIKITFVFFIIKKRIYKMSELII